MKLTKDTLIEGQIIKAGTEVRIKESFNSYVDDDYSRWTAKELISYGIKRGYEPKAMLGTPYVDEMVLFGLGNDDYKDLHKVNVKTDEGVYRYVTKNTMIGGMIPYIKVNFTKGLAYFMEAETFDDDVVIFDTKPVKVTYTRVLKNY